ncbi:hypothetical protein IAE35_16935 [Pseudomonas sp. S75]|uniref:DUF7079 family protein n=1 Tax=unclassified Pseudomonas TaxID=196821 RepID=UPI00190417C6|nr:MULTISPECIES: hypothetical protein [unclassified Pseudomonas]MBJ9977656.1 hypothetical protein [Pseudomonas sp. S30]MBK0155028.1 hypothetical protein [Pseudomonas sp. S75]
MTAIGADRLMVWQALSELFLDTDVDASFDQVAAQLARSGYTPDQVNSVLWLEVYPVLHHNLRSMVGEWAGWTDAFLLEHLNARPFAPCEPVRGSVGAEVARCWSEVRSRWAALAKL